MENLSSFAQEFDEKCGYFIKVALCAEEFSIIENVTAFRLGKLHG